MLKAFVEKLLELGKVEQFTFDSRKYTSKKIWPVMPPISAAFVAHTLTGVKDYLVGNPDGLNLERIIVQVQDHQTVEVFSSIYPTWKDRDACLSVGISPKAFSFGQFISTEEMVIALQTYFVQTDTTANLMKVVGNVSDDTNIITKDDGIAQEVTVKSGVVRLEKIDLPNPVSLQPYRTFFEVEQPESKFVFRIRKGESGRLPGCALFEADGGNWQLEAVKRVRDWLRANLPEEVSTNIIA